MNIALLAAIALIANFHLGRWRSKYKKFTFTWWVLIHASIPLIVPLRIWLGTPEWAIPLFIVLALLGQFLGARTMVSKQE